MAIYGQSNQLLNMLGMGLISNPNSLTLNEYLEVGSEYPGITIVQYLIGKGVPGTYTFSQLLYSPDYFNYINEIMRATYLIGSQKEIEYRIKNYGQNSGIDVPQQDMSIEPQNKFMSYKPTNESIGDFWDYDGEPNYPPVSWTDSNGDFRVFELRNVQSVLADGTLIFEAYDVNFGD